MSSSASRHSTLRVDNEIYLRGYQFLYSIADSGP
jgi:hypothetical protein